MCTATNNQGIAIFFCPEISPKPCTRREVKSDESSVSSNSSKRSIANYYYPILYVVIIVLVNTWCRYIHKLDTFNATLRIFP